MALGWRVRVRRDDESRQLDGMPRDQRAGVVRQGHAMVALALSTVIGSVIGHRTIIPIFIRRQPGRSVGTAEQFRELMGLTGQADADPRAEHEEQKRRDQRQSANTCESEAGSGHRNQPSERGRCYTISLPVVRACRRGALPRCVGQPDLPSIRSIAQPIRVPPWGIPTADEHGASPRKWMRNFIPHRVQQCAPSH